MPDPADIAKKAFRAYAESDRDTIESLIAPDLSFTSPYDNGIGRETYFERCWPNHKSIKIMQFVRAFAVGDEVIVTYEGERTDGHSFRNSEFLTIRCGQIHAVEVYFGWNVPHPTQEGGFVNPT